MRFIFSILLIVIAFNSKGQLVRDYFFKDTLSSKDTNSLIVVVSNPQSEFSKKLGHRIYSDTNFINDLYKSWYIEYDIQNGRTQHRCDHDLYFYKLSGNDFILLNRLNSNCESYDIGSSKLNVLATNGKMLKIDTLTKIRTNSKRKVLFSDDMIAYSYIGNVKNWEYSLIKKYPDIYYEGLFTTKIILDTNFTINQNAEKFIKSFTENLHGVNWNIQKSDKTTAFENSKKSCEVEITVYLKSWNFDLFKGFKINPMNFEIPKGNKLILFYKT